MHCSFHANHLVDSVAYVHISSVTWKLGTQSIWNWGLFSCDYFLEFLPSFLKYFIFWGDNIIVSSLHFLSFLLALPWYLLPLVLFQIHSPSPVCQLLRMCIYIHISKYISTYSVYIMLLAVCVFRGDHFVVCLLVCLFQEKTNFSTLNRHSCL